jgi:hypothetical protein
VSFNIKGATGSAGTNGVTLAAIPSAFTTRTLVSGDNGKVLICASAQTATVNSGLTSGFGVSAKGLVTFTAGSGVTVNDIRTTGAANPWCSLTNIGSEIYDVVGSKP